MANTIPSLQQLGLDVQQPELPGLKPIFRDWDLESLAPAEAGEYLGPTPMTSFEEVG